MDSVDIEVLRSAEAWRKAGHKVALGTIVKTWGSAPRPVGAMVAVPGTNYFKFDTTTSGQRLSVGETAIVEVKATIDGAPRTFVREIPRNA